MASWVHELGRVLLLYQDRILLIVIFISITAAITVGLIFVADKVSPRRLARKESIDLKQYYPEILGGLIGFAVLSDYPVWAVLATVGGGAVGHLGKAAYRWLVGKVTEEKRVGEILLLYEIISIYSSAGYSLYEALSVSVYLMDLVEKPLRKCLQSWGQGPQRALAKFGEELNVPEGKALSRILQRAVVIGPGRLTDFLDRESATMEVVRQYRVERGLGVRPIVQTLYLVFPGLALMGTTLFPIGYHIANMIMSVRLN